MKKLIFVAAIVLAVAGIVSAQNWGWGGSPRGVSQSVTVTGTLQLRNGTIAVTSGETVCYVPDLARYIGFIDGLKEGAQVTVQGYVYGDQAFTYLQPATVTLAGKDYDFSTANAQGGSCCGYGFNAVARGMGRARW
ncbi:MAG: hypothetical protein LBS86_05835 [Treponema sp.]|jgi:hypothetical protein|nr:hypothetical protein [Treponema sp.]